MAIVIHRTAQAQDELRTEKISSELEFNFVSKTLRGYNDTGSTKGLSTCLKCQREGLLRVNTDVFETVEHEGKIFALLHGKTFDAYACYNRTIQSITRDINGSPIFAIDELEYITDNRPFNGHGSIFVPAERTLADGSYRLLQGPKLVLPEEVLSSSLWDRCADGLFVGSKVACRDSKKL